MVCRHPWSEVSGQKKTLLWVRAPYLTDRSAGRAATLATRFAATPIIVPASCKEIVPSAVVFYGLYLEQRRTTAGGRGLFALLCPAPQPV